MLTLPELGGGDAVLRHLPIRTIAVWVRIIGEGVPIIVDSIGAGILTRIVGDVVPVPVDVEIAWQRDPGGVSVGIRDEIVEHFAVGVANLDIGPSDAVPSGQDTDAHEFASFHQTAPRGVLILNVDLADVEVLEIGERERARVRRQGECEWHVHRRHDRRRRHLQAFRLDVGAFRTEPLHLDRMGDIRSGGVRDELRLDSDPRFRDVVDLGLA